MPKLYQLACGEDVCEVNLSSEPGFQALDSKFVPGEACFIACVHEERSGTVPCSLLNHQCSSRCLHKTRRPVNIR